MAAVPAGRRGGRLGLLLDLPLEEAAALGLVHHLHVVVDGHVGAVGCVAVVLGTAAWGRIKANTVTTF